MLTRVFCIYDSKVGAYLQPFFSQSKGAALRAVQELVADPKHNFCKYSEDFTLFELGGFDDSCAKFELLSTPVSICLFSELKVKDVS